MRTPIRINIITPPITKKIQVLEDPFLGPLLLVREVEPELDPREVVRVTDFVPDLDLVPLDELLLDDLVDLEIDLAIFDTKL